MNQFIQELLRGNGAYSNDSVCMVKRHQLSEEGQKPKAIIVTCADSRVIPEQIFRQEMGTFLTIKNAGARITDDVLRDIASFIKKFDSVFMVIHMAHSQCAHYEDAVKHGIDIEPEILESLRKSFNSEEQVIDQISKMNMVEGVKRISEVVPKHIEVRGAFYDIKAGSVFF
ncbi:MAG: carbonic anhydrase [Deltaproteobacteria bacterium]